MLPDVSWHGVWVKQVGTKRFGKIAYVDYPIRRSVDMCRGVYTTFEEPAVVWVMWHHKRGFKTGYSAGACSMEDLEVLAVGPDPWYPDEKRLLRESLRYLEVGLVPSI